MNGQWQFLKHISHILISFYLRNYETNEMDIINHSLRATKMDVWFAKFLEFIPQKLRFKSSFWTLSLDLNPVLFPPSQWIGLSRINFLKMVTFTYLIQKSKWIQHKLVGSQSSSQVASGTRWVFGSLPLCRQCVKSFQSSHCCKCHRLLLGTNHRKSRKKLRWVPTQFPYKLAACWIISTDVNKDVVFYLFYA